MADAVSGFPAAVPGAAPMAADGQVAQILTLLQALSGMAPGEGADPSSPNFLNVADQYSMAGFGLQESVGQGFGGMVSQVVGLGMSDPYVMQTGSLMSQIASNPSLMQQIAAAPAGAPVASSVIYEPDSAVPSADNIFDPGLDPGGADPSDG